MKKILVTTDLSANSRAGIRFGLQMAAQAGCDLVFYHLVEIMKPTSWNDRRFASFAETRLSELDEEVRRFINEAATDSGHRAGYFTVKLEIGTHIAKQTVNFAKKINADYICLGTRGGGKLRKLLGSNSSELLISSHLPVIVVPPNYRTSVITSLFYACDLENLAPEIKKVREFAGALSAGVVVYHYNRTLVVSDNLKLLERKTAKYANAQMRFVFRKLEVDEPLSRHLTRDIKKEKPSLLVLFTRPKRSWFNRLFSHSKSAEMALKPTLPIVVFRKK